MALLRHIARTYVLCVLAALVLCACEDEASEGLTRALTGRGRVAFLGGADLGTKASTGTQMVDAATLPEVRAALAGGDESAVVATMAAANLRGIVVDARPSGISMPPASIAAKLAAFARMEGLTGAYLAPFAAFYVLDPTHEWNAELCAAMAQVARRLLAGAPEPRLTSFPDAVRRVEPVEVMVLLREGSHPRLWRSARGSSFARALLTAADVARKRWNEREQAMGGPLDKFLPKLTVDIALLQDDGELGSRERGFIDRVVGPLHGVAYEQKGAWRYLLPETTHTPKGRSPTAAYLQLFEDDGLPEGSLTLRELRLYRMAVRIIATSEPSVAKDAIFDVTSPKEVLGK